MEIGDRLVKVDGYEAGRREQTAGRCGLRDWAKASLNLPRVLTERPSLVSNAFQNSKGSCAASHLFKFIC